MKDRQKNTVNLFFCVCIQQKKASRRVRDLSINAFNRNKLFRFEKYYYAVSANCRFSFVSPRDECTMQLVSTHSICEEMDKKSQRVLHIRFPFSFCRQAFPRTKKKPIGMLDQKKTSVYARKLSQLVKCADYTLLCEKYTETSRKTVSFKKMRVKKENIFPLK